MAIKYVSGKTRELKVGLSSYSEGKPSLQVTGNVGVGTTNPLSLANPANTSVISAGIVTANKLYGDIVATGVGITNLFVSGISTFIGNVHVSAAGTVGLGTTAYFGYNNDFKIYDDTAIGQSSKIHTKNTLQLKSTAPGGFAGIKSEVTLTFGMGATYLESDLFYLLSTSGTLLEADARNGGIVKLRYGNSQKLVTKSDGIQVTGNIETDSLYNSGISTFAGISTFVGVSTFNNDVEFIGDAAGITSAFWDKSANELKFYDGSKASFGDGQDLQIYHSGSHSFIDDIGTGNLKLRSNNLRLSNADESKLYAAFQAGAVELYHENAERLRTTGIGISVVGVGSTAYIEGPDNIIIDPHPYGIGATSGNVFIRGDLYVEGTEFIVDVDKIELGDFQIGIATTAGTNALLDGAGIGIGSTNIRKFITWNNATNALMTSENWNLASGKHYEINGTDVLTSDTLLVGTGASVHSPSNNILTLHTNGAEKLRIDASGNLGIGTAVPTDSANAANSSVTSAGIVTALEYYGIFKGSIPGFSTVFSSSSGSFSATPGTPQIIDTFAFSTHDYQIAEYTLHFVHANGIQAQKALVMQDNSVAYSNEYGVMYDSELLVSIAATVSSGNVNITATPEAGISGVTTFRWRREVQT